MKIERLKIENFRCFGPAGVDIKFQDDLTAFVGNNGSGKTAIFHALGRLFGPTTAQRRVTKKDFHLARADAELSNGAMLTIECHVAFPELEADEDDPSVPDVFYQMAASGEGAPLKLRIRLEAVWEEDLTPEGTVTEELKWVGTFDEDYDWDQCTRVAAIDRSLIQLIYVPASRNAFDQVTSLLKGRLWKAAKWSQDLKERAAEASSALQEAFEDEAPADFIIERLAKRWDEVRQGDTAAAPSLQLVESRLEDLLNRAEFAFTPTKGSGVHRLDDFSDGQRSLFHIALTAATLEIERDALAASAGDALFDQERLRRTALTILAIEEPENSLSPFFLSRIMQQSRDIGGMREAQVILSSHSASILSRVEPTEVRYTRLAEKTRRSSVRPLTLPATEDEASAYVRLAVRAYPELYFARFVILAEGDSESMVLPRLADAMDIPLDRSFVPVVPLGGRFVRHFWKLLDDLKIPYATLLDLDLGRKHGGAAAIRGIVDELAAIGNDLSENPSVILDEVDLSDLETLDDAELLDEDQGHPWLKALQHENIFFSSPIDLDFAMLMLFPSAYQKVRDGGLGPRDDAKSLASKKVTTLKTGGTPELYNEDYDREFTWYPYLFLAASKPESHLRALAEITPEKLAKDAPNELKSLLKRVEKALR
jgi:predicted ATPase